MFRITQEDIAGSGQASLLPEGEYAATIHAEEKISRSSGKNMIEVECDTGRGKVWEYIVEGQASAGKKAVRICRACGIQVTADMDISARTFNGKRCRIVVKHEVDDQGKTRARIDKWVPAETQAQSATVASTEVDGIPF